jgi:hypothetical protein
MSILKIIANERKFIFSPALKQSKFIRADAMTKYLEKTAIMLMREWDFSAFIKMDWN